MEEFAHYFIDDESKRIVICIMVIIVDFLVTDDILKHLSLHHIFFSVILTPFFSHVLGGWNLRHHPNVHFMFYEDMKRVMIIAN